MEVYNCQEIEYKDGTQIRIYKFPYSRKNPLTDEEKKEKKKRQDFERCENFKKLSQENPFVDDPNLITEISEDIELDPDPVAGKLKSLSVYSSRNRTMKKIYEIARSNTWDYMLTFTFNPKIVNRFDYDAITEVFTKWINRIKHNQAPNLKYLIVPELHKDGAFHFHGLLADVGKLEFVDSGRVQRNSLGVPVLEDGKQITIYNLKDYNLGFSTATKIRNNGRATAYITKYVTKELTAVTDGKKRYWRSKNLEKPNITRSFLTDPDNTKEVFKGFCDYMKVTDIVDDGVVLNNVTYIEVSDYEEK